MIFIELGLSSEILLPLLEVRFTIKNLSGGNVQLRNKIGGIDFKQEVSHLDLLIIVYRDVNDGARNAGCNSDDIRPDLRIPRPGIVHVPLVKGPGSPACQANDDQSYREIEKTRLHGKQTNPIRLLSKTTKARKKRGRCQI